MDNLRAIMNGRVRWWVLVIGMSLLVAWGPGITASFPPSEWEGTDESQGLRAFRAIASVLTSPRCMNCHVPSDSPLQGDEGRPHTMQVKRGADGRGTPAMRCANCHQITNARERHAPPGVADWRMPAAATPMAWQGLTTAALCRDLKDPAKNGGKSLTDLLDHVSSDKLVLWGWNPGPGRTLPPLSHAEFVAEFTEWVRQGAPCAP